MSTTPYSVVITTMTSYRVKSGSKLFNEPRRPLKYRGTHSVCHGTYNQNLREGSGFPFRSWLTEDYDRDLTPVRIARNKALQKWKSELGPSAQLGSTLAMYRESVEMVVNRATTLRKAVVALRKGQFRLFLKELNIVPKKRHVDLKRSKPRQAGSLWLEYWMGWAPLAGDLFSAHDVITRPFPVATVKGTARSDATPRKFFSNVSNLYIQDYTASGVHMAKIQAKVRVVNPNLYLADQMGLLNPVYILYDMMPWSWMLNWFVNLEQMTQSFADPWGLEIKEPFTTIYTKMTGRYAAYHYMWGPPVSGVWEGYSVRRELYLPSYKWVFQPPKGLSITRGLTAVSLLLQQLKEIKP